tara:strand:+ start:116 stop:295 length:180 start_codon:yes stop_codon:yes gene_type:complete
MKERLMVVLELEDGQAVVVSTKELMQHKEQIEERLKQAEIQAEIEDLPFFRDVDTKTGK